MSCGAISTIHFGLKVVNQGDIKALIPDVHTSGEAAPNVFGFAYSLGGLKNDGRKNQWTLEVPFAVPYSAELGCKRADEASPNMTTWDGVVFGVQLHHPLPPPLPHMVVRNGTGEVRPGILVGVVPKNGVKAMICGCDGTVRQISSVFGDERNRLVR